MQRLLLAVIVSFGLVAFAYGETTDETNCESHRRNSQNSGHGLSWNIECDEEGKYRPMQCTNDTDKKKWCACYNKEEAITQPSRKTRTCACPLKKDDATRNGEKGCHLPQCSADNTGKFKPKHCCSDTCHCVNPDTGAKTSEPQRNPNLQC